MTTINWLELTNPLFQAAAKLGIDVSDLKAREQVERLQFSVERLSGVELSQQTPQELKATLLTLVETYGSSISLRFILQSKTLLQIRPEIPDEEINSLLEKIHDGLEPRIDLNLDKRQLLTKLLPPENYPNVVAKLFFFPEALQRALSIPLPRLEAKNGLWYEMDDQHRLVIIVPDQEISLTGEYLVVLGGKALEQLPTYLAWPEPSLGELTGRMRDQALHPLSPVKWLYFKLKFLTPVHLHVEGMVQTDDAIAPALYTQLLKLCLIYTADRTKGPAEGDLEKEGNAAEWHSTFTEREHIAEVIWNGETRVQESNADLQSNSLAWSEMVSFAYSDTMYSFDRLRIIQLTTANYMEDVGTNLSYDNIVSRALQIHNRIQNSWEAFIEGKIKEYFTQLRDIEQAVDTVTEKFQGQFDALTRSVFENMLATVGVLIGTFIAAAFRDKFNPGLFWIGIIVYLLYLSIFPNWLGLQATRERFDRTVAAFEKRVRDFKSRLSPSVVDTIVGDVLSHWKSQFEIWFRRAQISYRTVIILLLLVAIAVTIVTSVNAEILSISTTAAPTDVIATAMPSATFSLSATPPNVATVTP